MNRNFRNALGACIAAAALLVATPQMASAEGYGAAGCGLGSVIFGDDEGFMQVFAATTNQSFGTQVFGIISGTSNCADSGDDMASAKAYIEANREALAREAARGTGETIAALSSVAGCTDAAAVGVALQSSFDQIFPAGAQSDTDVSAAMIEQLRTNTALACGNLG